MRDGFQREKDGDEKIKKPNNTKNPRNMEQTFKINGMSCGSCKQTAEKSLRVITGVASVQVSLNPP